MSIRRAVRRAAWCLALVAGAGCSGRQIVTATELPKEPRHPDGVVLDPPPALPDAGDRAEARGVVALREPLGDGALEDVVTAYFDAWAREDLEGLAGLLASDAVSLDPRLRGGRSTLLDAWRARIRSLDYTKTAGLEDTSGARIEQRRFEDLGVPGAPPRPAGMEPGDVLVRVPVPAPRIHGERFFGDSLVLLLRRRGDRLEIAAVAEEDDP